MNRRLLQQMRDYLRTFIRPDNLISYPQIIECPPGERVVVFSPHLDDDVIGCGGTLHKHVRAGHQVAVVYFTDGREGDPSNPDKRRVEEIRKEEARRATKLLGIEHLIFLDEPESHLKSTPKLVETLNGILDELNPDLLYIPSYLENHIDHFEVNRILMALSKRRSFGFNIAAYEVWTPLLPNLIVDIGSTVTKKEEALREYGSQIRQVDYVRTTLALNQYRSGMHLGGRGHAEAFLFMPSAKYLRLMQDLKIAGRLFIDRKAREAAS